MAYTNFLLTVNAFLLCHENELSGQWETLDFWHLSCWKEKELQICYLCLLKQFSVEKKMCAHNKTFM